MAAGTPTELCRQPVESASPGLHACRCTLESLGCMYGLSEKSGGVRHTSGERLLRLRLRPPPRAAAAWNAAKSGACATSGSGSTKGAGGEGDGTGAAAAAAVD